VSFVSKQRERKLQEVQRFATIGPTAGMVGHDIRNPLQTIVSATYLLKEEISNLTENESKKSMKDSIETIDEQAQYTARILTNLVGNAVQAMPNGGKLTIAACRENGKAVLTVEDTGVGMPEEVKSQIFQPLFTTKSKG